MWKKNIILFISVCAFTGYWFSCQTSLPKFKTEKLAPSHQKWNLLLQRHVGDDGLVNYKGFIRDSALLQEYLDQLSDTHPRKQWSEKERKAYWINAYNAFTVKLILDYYPVKSIKDIKKGIAFVNSVWDIKFVEIEGETYDLNNIEHGILRKYFPDARIHAAINCASISCPPLRAEAFVASELDAQLDDAMKKFINDPIRNRVQANKAEISKIFSWFSGDFKKHAGSVRTFFNNYAHEKILESSKIKHLEYDWNLNESGN